MALPTDYVSLSGKDKLDRLWAEVSENPYSDNGLPAKPPSAWERRKLFSVGFTRTSFEHVSDEMPAGRTKLVHAYGTSAKVTVTVTDAQGYTGVFATGGPALMRFSDAAGGGKIPSLALKFMIDGRPSRNYFALPNPARDPDNRDPLSGVYANAVAPPQDVDTKLVGWAFQRTANALGGKRLYSVYLPLHHLAQMGSHGEAVTDARVPDRLEFHGLEAASKAMASHRDWRRSVASLPAGTRLFDLKISGGIDQPAVAFGFVTLDVPFVASRYGDERLFFQHDVGPK